MKIEVTAEGWEEERIVDFVVQHLAERIEAGVEARIKERVDKVIGEKLETAVGDEIDKAVATAINEGWAASNRYGEPNGRVITTKERVSEWLAEKTHYHNRISRREAALAKAVNAAIDKEFAGELKEIRESFRAQVDAALKAKLGETLRSALGLGE